MMRGSILPFLFMGMVSVSASEAVVDGMNAGAGNAASAVSGREPRPVNDFVVFPDAPEAARGRGNGTLPGPGGASAREDGRTATLASRLVNTYTARATPPLDGLAAELEERGDALLAGEVIARLCGRPGDIAAHLEDGARMASRLSYGSIRNILGELDRSDSPAAFLARLGVIKGLGKKIAAACVVEGKLDVGRYAEVTTELSRRFGDTRFADRTVMGFAFEIGRIGYMADYLIREVTPLTGGIPDYGKADRAKLALAVPALGNPALAAEIERVLAMRSPRERR